jgi:hypothetical protein
LKKRDKEVSVVENGGLLRQEVQADDVGGRRSGKDLNRKKICGSGGKFKTLPFSL